MSLAGPSGQDRTAGQNCVLVTGSAGRLGRAVLADLVGADYRVVGVDRVSGPEPSDGVRLLDWDGCDVDGLSDALSGCSGLIHLAAIPSPYSHPDEVVFCNNTGATFAALQAASQAGIKRVAIASSVSAYGTAWSPQPTHPLYVPVDEDHPLRNYDAYGLSKEVDERTAEMFSRRNEMSVAALRFHWIATREEQIQAAASVHGTQDWPEELRTLWGYVDIRDAARACRLALEAAGDHPYGFAPMNIVAADLLTDQPLTRLLAEHAPHIEIRGDLAGGAGAFATERARQIINWSPRYSWRDVPPDRPHSAGR